MKTIIAPTDFSIASHNAVTYAARLAAYVNGRLVLLHVIGIPPGTLELPVSGMEMDALEAGAGQGLQEEEERIDPDIRKQISISAELRYGMVDEQIENLGDEHDTFAVVIGFRHRDALSRMMWGSHTLRMIEYSKYPLLLIPQGLSFKPLKQMTLACDMKKEISNSSVQHIKEWVNVFHSLLEILNVYDQESFPPEETPLLTGLRQKISSVNAVFTFIKDSHIDEALQLFIMDKKPDLLIVLPEQRGYLESLFHRSHSKRIIQAANLPILSIPLQTSVQDQNSHREFRHA